MAQGGMNLNQQFINFSKFGDTKSDGTTITLTQIDKWFKQAQIFDKKITTTDTGITFNKFKYVKIFLERIIKFKKLGRKPLIFPILKNSFKTWPIRKKSNLMS